MLSIVIDTREQQPWHFPAWLATVTRGALPAGDYALAGDTGFAIERKSLDDLVQTITLGRERFDRELARMQDAGYPARVVIVEGLYAEVIGGQYRAPSVTPQWAQERLADLSYRGVCILFAGTPVAATGLAYSILLKREHERETLCRKIK